jgi:hypothetical protein
MSEVEDLFVGELVAADLGLDQHAEQVVVALTLVLGEQAHEVAEHLHVTFGDRLVMLAPSAFTIVATAGLIGQLDISFQSSGDTHHLADHGGEQRRGIRRSHSPLGDVVMMRAAIVRMCSPSRRQRG